MDHRPLGRTGVQVSKLCLGTMMFGAWATRTTTTRSASSTRAGRRDQLRRHRRRLLRRRVGGDRRQGAQGPARRRRPGDEVLHADGRGPQPPRRLAALDRRAVEDSLRRLGTDCIDLYQVHRPDPDVDVEETLGALTDLVRQGKVRAIGSSSYSGGGDRRGAVGRSRAAASSGSAPSSRRTRCWCAASSSTSCRPPSVTAWASSPTARSPAAGCRAAGPRQLADLARAPAARRALRHVAAREPAQARGRRAAQQVADDAGLSMIELAIAFVVNHPGVTSAIIGPRTMEQLESQLPAADVVAGRRDARPHRRDRQARRQHQPRRHQLRSSPPSAAARPDGEAVSATHAPTSR